MTSASNWVTPRESSLWPSWDIPDAEHAHPPPFALQYPVDTTAQDGPVSQFFETGLFQFNPRVISPLDQVVCQCGQLFRPPVFVGPLTQAPVLGNDFIVDFRPFHCGAGETCFGSHPLGNPLCLVGVV